jgi:hypothetical protein
MAAHTVGVNSKVSGGRANNLASNAHAQAVRNRPTTIESELLELQRTAGNQAVLRLLAQRSQDGPSGLPQALRQEYETTGGVNLRDVRVHADSSRPSQFGALAMTQGSDIHVAPGQGEQLAHEAWHVVQQKQGRVSATGANTTTPINDDSALEQEADAAASASGAGPSTKQVEGVSTPATKLVSAEATDGKYTAATESAARQPEAEAVTQLAAKVKSLKVTHTSTSETATSASHRFDIKAEFKAASTDWDFRQDIKGFSKIDGVTQPLKSSGSGATISKSSWVDDGYTKADNTSSDAKVFETNDNPGGGFEQNKKEDYYLMFRARIIDPTTGKNIKSKSGYWIRITGKYPRKFKHGGFS